ncbi:glycosyltransferase family 1 protein [Frankia sp. CNm7]|uniref:Glycosyltransferase family 1 protein n=1 Tax=Frankia nepalensis TaxID=1836974 RepID=A0A937RP89_9ACTN|nr:glycosyltransferase [Frankia nepalensis]MBL7499550.1 glycosyltransferase family 1 protein [Frankia nepalensis]MBL7513178.1 glycosyltransferase family 1 protein [Frankia nepalensis]MBL7517595.1 glycosyltransferase family 1 protein [Frankia nepalensis]MBL7633682.1 glycosyltransferase family 1 protein [Frankia nepalensis]
MSRFLLVVPPLAGHITPLVAVADRLRALGHRVAWAGEPSLIRTLAGPDAEVHPALGGPVDVGGRGLGLRGYAAVQFLWEEFLIPLAEATHEAVADAAKQVDAGLVVADMQALAGAIAAARAGIPWVTSATTSGSLRDPFTATPRVRQWLDGLFADLITRLCPDPAVSLTPATLERSPLLVLAFTTEALAGPGDPAGPATAWVGPALRHPPEAGLAAVTATGVSPHAGPDDGEPFPWAWLDPDKPLVVVSLGTVNGPVGGRFLRSCVDALGALGDRVRAVVADPAGTVAAAPGNVLVRPGLPILVLLPHAAAVVCHGGHNTVCEALAHDLPLVVAPIRDDQPIVAQQVVDAGAGIRLHFGRATADLIAAAVTDVLTRPRYRLAAQGIGASFRAAGGAAAAADHLARLAVEHGRPG